MPLTTLHIARNRYRIEAIASRSQDGATYRALDLQRGVPVFLDERVPRPGTDAGTIARLPGRVAPTRMRHPMATVP